MEYDESCRFYVRQADGTELLALLGREQQGYNVTTEVTLFDASQTVAGKFGQTYDHEPGIPNLLGTENTMPDWWKMLSDKRIEWLFAEVKKTGKPVPATNNVVTFAMYRENGAMMGQMRSFVSPQGKPIGNPGMPSMHGGMMEDYDHPFYLRAMEMAVLREISEEFGVQVFFEDVTHLGDVYDADNARFNHVYRVKTSYEAALKDTYRDDIDGMLKAIFDCEGIGRLTRLFREDLERAMEIGGITPISIAILKAFPELMPPPAPKEAA